MYRNDALVIRLSKAERMAINRLARAEMLPASTLARRLLLQEAKKRGLLTRPADEQAEEPDSRDCPHSASVSE